MTKPKPVPLPCPFCGGAPKVSPFEMLYERFEAIVGCKRFSCHAKPSVSGSNERIAINRWNKRK